MMPVVTLNRAVAPPLCATFSAWAAVTSQWGVSVEGFSRPVTAAVHSTANQVRGFPPAVRARPRAVMTTFWPFTRPWFGETLTETPDAPAGGAGQGRGTDQAAQRHCGRQPPVHAEDLRTRFFRGTPDAASFHRGGVVFNAPLPGQRRNLPAGGRRLVCMSTHSGVV